MKLNVKNVLSFFLKNAKLKKSRQKLVNIFKENLIIHLKIIFVKIYNILIRDFLFSIFCMCCL